MTSGRDALHQIDARIAEMRSELARAADRSSADARLAADIDRRSVALFRRFAQIRVEHLKSEDAAPGPFAAADAETEAAIVEHERYLGFVSAKRDAAEAALADAERARREAEGAHDAAVNAHDEKAAQSRRRLEENAAYRERATAIENLNAMAARAERKLETARADREAKGAAFEADPLFVYLEQRRFGTRDYRAFPLFAMFDAMIARMIRYRDHRLNYARLVEIPQRFEEHVTRLKAEAATATDDIARMEREALVRDGVDAEREAVEAARARITALDAEIAEKEAAHEKLAASYAAAAEAREGPLADAATRLADALAEAPVGALRLAAAETDTPEDDALVDEIVRAKRERMELDEARRAAGGALDRRQRDLSELEGLRRRFKTARYDSPYSEFSGSDVIAILIAEMLRGAMSRDDVWRRIERGHRTRRRDWDNDFGGDSWRDGFGLPDNWGAPGPFRHGPIQRGPSGGGAPRMPRPPRIPRMPSGGGFGGGGGGRRGGGGFRTGGGF
jgi:hypothetical protein